MQVNDYRTLRKKFQSMYSPKHSHQETKPSTRIPTATIPTASDTAICDSIQHDYDLRVPYYCEENVWRLAYRKLYYQKQRTEQIKEASNELKSSHPTNDDHKRNASINERYYVAFISNHQKCLPMYHQRAASTMLSSSQSSSMHSNEKPCCFWDYHVILIGVTTTDSTSCCESYDNGDIDDKHVLVYDIDTTIVPYPVPLHQYLLLSFPNEFSSQNHTSRCMQYKPYFRIIPAEQYIQYFTSDRSHMFNEMIQSYNEPPPPYSCIVATRSADKRNSPLLTCITESVGSGTIDGTFVADTGSSESNFQKYVDFKTIREGGNIGKSSASYYGTIVTLEQLLHHDF